MNVSFSLLLLFVSFLMGNADHLVFSRITIKPDNAELISIKNPTSESISLNNYYISDNPNYYKIQTIYLFFQNLFFVYYI